MRVNALRAIKRVALGLVIGGLSVPASSVIYNVSATDSTGVVINLTPGKTYVAKLVGIADGGLYDAASIQFNCSVQCVTGFSNAFSSRDVNFNPLDFSVDSYSTNQVYGTAAASLAAYQAGPITHFETHVVNGVPTTTNLGPIPQPFVFTAEGDGMTRLLVVDTDNTRTNNSGGISLRIEEVAARVPEPASWAMMIGGFGLLGAAARRRASAPATA
ncbi:PEPxxWA-CTERM sorting domain-containing protein [Sphingomonas tabacisoli]|uniref:PEPxxWA-CTERM sorting domain-containing protein n=1 Tax=Sphingomonas tabacisoli TaxID=2249466 RepID=A0ABW4HYL4_9SPHN